MRVPLTWLHEYTRPDLTAARLAERLALTGTEVDRILRHGVGNPDGFVVGRVLRAEQHPDADRLRVCTVDIGGDEPTQIVCGAPNVAAGQTVAVVQPGSRMPDGTRLKKAKLRGVVSNGMILSERELEISSEHDGIMVLPDDFMPGQPLEEALALGTEVLELEITPNRPDCLGVYGVAREVHAATGSALNPPPWVDDPGTRGPVVDAGVAVETTRCARFEARVFEDVKVGPSPVWLRARLMAAGMRPISNVVDITNYVMLTSSQPLHAFDLDRVAGAQLTVRQARDGEKIETLDGVERALDPDVTVICDSLGPTSIAGVMGGARSEVHDDTTRVLLESASWDGPGIQRTSTKLALRSEASSRYEKGLSPESADEALALATRLLIDLAGARVADGTIDEAGPAGRWWEEPAKTIRLRDRYVQRLLGVAVPRERSAEILRALGFGVADAEDGIDATVPHFRRNDVTREADLVEEVARIDGVDTLPASLPMRRGAIGRLTERQLLRRRANDTLAGAGLHEILGWSWSPPELADRLRLPADDARRAQVAIENPMSADQGLLRTTLVGSLLDVARRNVARGMADVAIFESGAVYLIGSGNGSGPLPHEPHHLAALLTGAARPATWRESQPPDADFFAAKGVLELLLGELRVEWRVEPASEPFLHPGRTAAVLVRGADGEEARAGWLGELHPGIAGDWELERVAAFELDLDVIVAAAGGPVVYADYTSFPEVRQDLAVVVPDTVAAGDVERVVRDAGGALLASANVFDVYRGEQVGEDKVSLALRLAFRSPERTLTDDEVAQRRGKIEAALADRLGGSIRA